MILYCIYRVSITIRSFYLFQIIKELIEIDVRSELSNFRDG